jgi:MFS family permease
MESALTSAASNSASTTREAPDATLTVDPRPDLAEGTVPGADPESPPSTLQASPSSLRWGVLRHPHFRLVWLAAFGSYLGNWFEFVGTQWIITEKTESMVWSSYLGAAHLLPSLVFGILGGIVADRVNRRTLLIATQGVMLLIALALAAVVYFDVATPWVLIGLGLLQGITIAFNMPAWQVLIPRLVPREDLVKAITLQGISFNLARAVGPALAGVIMGIWSPSVLFLLNALSFVGVMAAVLRTPDAPAPAHEPGWHRHVWSDTKRALRFVLLERGPRAAFLATTIFAAFGTPVLRFLSIFVEEVYGLRPEYQEKVFGAMTGIMGIGAVVGGLSLKLVPAWYPKHHFIPFSVLMGGLWILLFCTTRNVWVAGAFMFFVGWFWMWAFNSAAAALQMLVSDSMRGRALAVCNTLAMGLMPAGYFFASTVGESSSKLVQYAAPDYWTQGIATQLGVGVCAFVLVVSGIVMVIWRTPEVDGLRPGDAGFDRRPGFLKGLFAGSHRP